MPANNVGVEAMRPVAPVDAGVLLKLQDSVLPPLHARTPNLQRDAEEHRTRASGVDTRIKPTQIQNERSVKQSVIQGILMSPRPRKFDYDEALRQAMMVFWTKGYEAASVSDLLDAMGINRFSMYEFFGDKHALFHKAADRYLEGFEKSILSRLRTNQDGLAAVRGHFANMVDYFSAPRGCRGCLMINSITEVSSQDSEIRELAQTFHRRLEEAFAVAIRNARSVGSIASTTPTESLARYLVSVSFSLPLIAQTYPEDRTRLEQVVEIALGSLAPRTPSRRPSG